MADGVAHLFVFARQQVAGRLRRGRKGWWEGGGGEGEKIEERGKERERERKARDRRARALIGRSLIGPFLPLGDMTIQTDSCHIYTNITKYK